jgi:hypothetical protein
MYRALFEVSKEAQAAIYEDILTSDAEAKELNETIPQYTVQHGGLAILNMFLLDLLGRTTNAARIFKNKFEEDFEETKAVSRWFQIFAVLVLLACNAFFIYYSLLKAFQKGKTWQYQYLKGCVAQILVETLLNETLECLWLNYCVPDLVRKEVKKATLVINQVVDQITTAASGSSGRSILFLDATAYLFASTKVAKAHPTLLESIVVLHYQSHLPGELSRAWPHCKRVAENDVVIVERNSALGRVFGFIPGFILSVGITVVLTLQLLGTTSFSFQRVVIRFVQPLLLSGLTLMWLFATDSKFGLVITIIGCVLLVAAFAWRQYYVYRKEQREAHSIAPDDVFQAEADEDMQDIESVPTSRRSTPGRENRARAEHAEPPSTELVSPDRQPGDLEVRSVDSVDEDGDEDQRRRQQLHKEDHQTASTYTALAQSKLVLPAREDRLKPVDASSVNSSEVLSAPSVSQDEVASPCRTAEKHHEEEKDQSGQPDTPSAEKQCAAAKDESAQPSLSDPRPTNTVQAFQLFESFSVSKFFDSDTDGEDEKPGDDSRDRAPAVAPERAQVRRNAVVDFADLDDEVFAREFGLEGGGW